MAALFQHSEAEDNSLLRFCNEACFSRSTTTDDNNLTLALQKQSPSVSGRGEGPFSWWNDFM